MLVLYVSESNTSAQEKFQDLWFRFVNEDLFMSKGDNCHIVCNTAFEAGAQSV